MKLKKRFLRILKKSVPLWLVLAIVIDSSVMVGVLDYYLMKRELRNALVKLQKTSDNPDQLVQILKDQVIPQKGYTTSLKWKNLGKQLVDIGAIDKAKYQEAFGSEVEMKYLEGDSNDHIMVNERNSKFLVNTFWALGLVNKNKILDEGSMKDAGDIGNFASTGGWTLGSMEPMELYSSKELIKLNPKQQELVEKIAENVFRPCCSNPTSFPDCNHGMAALGYIEYAVSENLSEKQIYKDLLAFNSYWFPQNYIEMAAFFNKQNTDWSKVDAKLALSSDYSSAVGSQKIKQSIQDLPGFELKPGGCSA